MATSRAAALAERSSRARRVTRILTLILVPLAVLTLVGLVALWPRHIPPDLGYRLLGPDQHIYDAKVVSVGPLDCDGPDYENSPSGAKPTCGTANVTLLSGPDRTSQFSVDLPPENYEAGLPAGTKIRVVRTPATDDYPLSYSFYDVQRSHQLWLIAALFAAVVVAVAGLRGLRALAGLLVAFAVLAKFVIPALLSGRSGPLVGIVAAAVIMFVVLYLAHGPTARTSSALLGTLLGLGLTGLLGWLAVGWTHLSGGGTVDDSAIATIAGKIDLTGLLVCGIIIAGLGALNDVTITQTSAVWELRAFAPDLPNRELFASAMRIGRDHIASIVYTIVFAYVGTALPTLVLVNVYRLPFFDVLTGEQVAEEVVRTLIGSIGLILVVPATTIVAIWTAPAARGDEPPAHLHA